MGIDGPLDFTESGPITSVAVESSRYLAQLGPSPVIPEEGCDLLYALELLLLAQYYIK